MTTKFQFDEELLRELRDAFTDDGMQFGLDNFGADKLLKRCVGPTRFRKFCQLMDAVRHGLAPIEEAYQCFGDVKSALAHISSQSDTSLATTAALIQLSGVLPGRHRKVAELGCHAGTALRYLGRALPGVAFAGFDRVAALLRDAQSRASDNVCFVEWDYQLKAPPDGYAEFDLLYGALPIEFKEQLTFDPLTRHGRLRPEVKRVYDATLRPATHWRAISLAGARLFLCARIVNAPSHVVMLSAFAASGWRLEEGTSFKLMVGREYFPVLELTAVEPFELDTDLQQRLMDEFPNDPVVALPREFVTVPVGIFGV